MKCPVCGAEAAQIEFKSGKGKINKAARFAGGLIAGPLGLVAAIHDERSKQYGYLHCSTCGYDQFASVDPNCILRIEEMEPLDNGTYYSFDIPFTRLLDQFNNAAANTDLVFHVRLDEINRMPAGISLASYPCVIIEHPDHPQDYCKFCITKNVDGSRCMLTPYVFGSSPQLQMENYNENVPNHSVGGLATAALGFLSNKRSSGFVTSQGIGYEVGHFITTSIIKHKNSKKMDAGALQWEKLWYGEIMELIKSVLN
ncbi:MAG: hypothetical protein IKI69_08695 [Oscillospiraceae bacterium]|nr:hypothetical protein [Oscillospiraceae bacterium]